MKYTLLLLSLIVIPFTHSYAQCFLQKPNNLQVTSVSSCDAVVDWSAVTGATLYKIQYKVSSSAAWITVNAGNATSYTVTGLAADTKYSVQVASFCSDNTTQGYSKPVIFQTLVCSAPQQVFITAVTDSSATISWQAKCNSSLYNLKYRVTGTSGWTKVNDLNNTTYKLKKLLPATNYDVQLQSNCGQNTSDWTETVTFITANSGQRPNILVILMDDGRYDTFLPTGGPNWFKSPSINRIAYEGVNFQYMIPSTSQCAPSRVSIYTGLYGHHNGVLNNGNHMSNGTLVQQVLTDNGYYTGFVGKYGQGQGVPKGFNWYAVTTNDFYNDPPYIVNGKDTTIKGNILDTYPALALTFLKDAPADKPFMLMFFTRAPHTPSMPRKEDSHLYENERMPFPSNFYTYSKNYPDFFYGGSLQWKADSATTISNTLKEYQTLAGIEYDVDTLISYLEKKGLLNNTLIFFTSDNGYLKGEHLLQGKEIMQEESIRLPFFVRYPKWFSDSAVIKNQIASTIDIAPTMLDAAGISNTYNMDGVSLHKLVTGEIKRPLFYYEFGGQKGVPSNRGIRSLDYTYVHHYCSSTTEEFYDLVNDPKENTNQINNSDYAQRIQQYKKTLDSLQTALGDTDPIEDISCFLKNIVNTREPDSDDEGVEMAGNLFTISPNPVENQVSISFSSETEEPLSLFIYNVLDQQLFADRFESGSTLNMLIDTHEWKPGLYMVTIKQGNQKFTQKMNIVH